MPKRPLIIAFAVVLLTVACSEIPEGEVVPGDGVRFVPAVADFLDDVGLGGAVAVDADGIPFYSYWIFPAELEEGEVPATRPIGAPYIQAESTPEEPGAFGAAVGVGSVSPDGIFTRGAAAQVRDTPQGITIPFGPATVEPLLEATAQNTNGTDIAIDDAGGKHVVWAGPDGIWYAGGTDSFEAEQVFDYGSILEEAGPIGRPSVAVDAQGAPWVAYTVSLQGSQRVEVATQTEGGWDTQLVSETPCASCPPPQHTQIGVTAEGPVVAYIDTAAGELLSATPSADVPGAKWIPAVVAADTAGDGLAMAVDADGNPILTFYGPQGGVQLADSAGGAWSVEDVATGSPPAEGISNQAPTTGISVDDEGVRYVTYAEGDTIVLLSSADGGEFAPVDIGTPTGGAFPDVAAAPDGSSVYLTWYGVDGEDLRLGVWGDVQELQVAQPSPTSEVEPPTTGGDCGQDGEIALDIVAEVGLVFDTQCLVAPSGEPFEIIYSNVAPDTHNINVTVEQGGDSLGATELSAGAHPRGAAPDRSARSG